MLRTYDKARIFLLVDLQTLASSYCNLSSPYPKSEKNFP